MVKRDGAFTRKERINNIRSFILRAKEPLSLGKTLAVLQLKHGLTRQRVREYLDVIVDLDGVTIDEERDLIVPQSSAGGGEVEK